MNAAAFGWAVLDACLRPAAGGYVDSEALLGEPAWALDAGSWVPVTPTHRPGWSDAELVVILPTALARTSAQDYPIIVRRLVDQLADAAGPTTPGRAGLVAVIQCTDEVELSSAQERGKAVAAATDESVPLMVLLSMARGKVAALNLAIRTLGPSTQFVGWVDDDVQLGPHCLARMLHRLRDLAPPAAVGATKVPHTSQHQTSAALARAKAAMPSAMNYPHGCALMVCADVVADGVPRRYANDDGWICFQLLRPKSSDPFAHLVLVPDASVHYTVAGDLRSSVRRLRRQRLGQILLAADADPARRHCYISRSFLNGVDLFPVRSGRPIGQALALGLYSWVHVLTSALLVAELMVRAVVGRPLQHMTWGSPTTLDARSTHAGTSSGQR